MRVVIGVGESVTQTLNQFKKDDNYTVIHLDIPKKGDTMEEYEAGFPESTIKSAFRGKAPKGCDALFVVYGGVPENGILLRAIEMLKKKDATISVFYMVPSLLTLSTRETAQHNLAFGALQELTRSGLMERFFVADIEKVEEMLENIPVAKYEEYLHSYIVANFSMINYFNHVKSAVHIPTEIPTGARICSLAAFDFESAPSDFFTLAHPTTRHYYFGVPKKQLEEDGSLFRKIKEFMKTQEQKGVNNAFSIHEADLDNTRIWRVSYTSEIQAT